MVAAAQSHPALIGHGHQIMRVDIAKQKADHSSSPDFRSKQPDPFHGSKLLVSIGGQFLIVTKDVVASNFVEVIHGRMKAAEKQATMRAFKDGTIDLLVATTVIEVGVDVPNASLMIIENAERLGLAQLHQLRGGVGRGSAASSCVLLYQSPLSQLARERLETMRETNDGVVIAEKDLELRGPGELLGTRQTGLAGFRVADLARDADLLPQVHEVGARLLEQAPELAERIVARWVGGAARYASA